MASITRVLLMTVVGGSIASAIAAIPALVLRAFLADEDHPAFTIVLVAGAQLGLLGLAWSRARAETTDVRARLSFVKPEMPTSTTALAMLATLFVWALGVLGYELMHVDQWLPQADSGLAKVAQVFSDSPWPWRVAMLLVASLGPGICEEVLFRGYLQTRLLMSWRPAAAIACSGSLFALFHVDPHQILAIWPNCYWLGYVAARSRSIIPGMFCHAFVNLCAQSSLEFGVLSSGDTATAASLWPIYAAGLVGLPAFCLVVRRFAATRASDLDRG